MESPRADEALLLRHPRTPSSDSPGAAAGQSSRDWDSQSQCYIQSKTQPLWRSPRLILGAFASLSLTLALVVLYLDFGCDTVGQGLICSTLSSIRTWAADPALSSESEPLSERSIKDLELGWHLSSQALRTTGFMAVQQRQRQHSRKSWVGVQGTSSAVEGTWGLRAPTISPSPPLASPPSSPLPFPPPPSPPPLSPSPSPPPPSPPLSPPPLPPPPFPPPPVPTPSPSHSAHHHSSHHKSPKASPPPQGAPEADRELFARALKQSPEKPRGTPKVAFMFLTAGPLPLAPLWAKFLAGHEGKYSIYIHTPENYRYEADELPEAFRGRTIPSKNSSWGDITLVDAERRLLANAYLDRDNYRFVLLSEACIPLHPFDTVYRYLTSSNYSYVEVKRERDDDKCWSRRFLPLIDFWDWRKGSQWFELKRDLVPLVLKDSSYYAKFGWTFMRFAYADEHYLPTMLRTKAAPQLANFTVTRVEWPSNKKGPTPHPITYDSSVVSPKMLKKMRWESKCEDVLVDKSPCHLFARKFKVDVLPVLLNSTWVLGF